MNDRHTADTITDDALDALYERLRKAERAANLLADAHRRAEALERAMESTAADALAHRGCHRDLMAQCLRAERAEAALDRVRAVLADPAALDWRQRIRDAIDQPKEQ